MKQDLLSSLWTADQPPVLAPRDWELLLLQANATRLSARLALHFQAKGWVASVPVRVWQHLQSATRYDVILRRDVMQEIRHLTRALSPLQTPVVLLKGAAYLAGNLPPARGRLFSDVDILVRADQLRAVELALFAAGWMPEKLKPYDDRYYRQWMHELPPMQHVRRRTHLDVHHTLAPPTSRFVIDGRQMMERAQPVAIPGMTRTPMHILAPSDLVLHSVLHLMQEGEFHSGLRDLLDIRDLLVHYGAKADFWSALEARSRELGLDAVLDQVLGQLERLFNFVPPATWRKPARTMGAAALQSFLSKVLAPPVGAREPAPVRTARMAMYVRSHWLRMPWYQIVPHIVRKAWARISDRPTPIPRDPAP